MLLEKCVWAFCLNVCLCIKCTPSAWGGRKRASVPLKLMFHMVVSHCADGGNWTWLLCKNRQCSEPLGSPSRLIYTLKMTLFSTSVQEWSLHGQSQRLCAPMACRNGSCWVSVCAGAPRDSPLPVPEASPLLVWAQLLAWDLQVWS